MFLPFYLSVYIYNGTDCKNKNPQINIKNLNYFCQSNLRELELKIYYYSYIFDWGSYENNY